jgi:hypothetical protein
MPEYICERCGWKTMIKTQLRNHYLRKTPCKSLKTKIEIKDLLERDFPEFLPVINDIIPANKIEDEKIYNCIYCRDSFKTYYSKWRHEKVRCKVLDKSDENLYLEQIKEKDKIIEELIGKIGNQTINNTVNNNVNNSVNNNVNVTINAFGNENISYISHSFLDSLLIIPYSSVPRLLEHIHFNDQFPQNKNVRITNKKEKWAEINNGISWEFIPKNTLINEMITNSFNILETHYEEKGKEILSDIKKERWEKFSEDFYDEKPSTIKRLYNDTECLILNKTK